MNDLRGADTALMELVPAPEVRDERRRPSRRRWWHGGDRWLAIVCLGVLTVLVAVPLITMITQSWRPSGVLPFDSGGVTLAPVRQALTALGSGGVLKATVIFSLGSLIVALIIAFPLAFLSERTDFRFGNRLYLLMFANMSVPAFAFALAWVLLMNPQTGLINSAIRYLSGSSGNGPFNIYTMEGLIFVQGIGIVPSVWLVLISVLRNYNSTHDDAARVAGAGRWRTITFVTIPIMRPAIIAVAIIFFLAGVQSLDVSIAIAPQARVPLLPVRIFLAVQPSGTQLPDYSLAAAFGLLSLAVSAILIIVYLRMLGHAELYNTISGRDGEVRRASLGRASPFISIAVGLYALIAIVLPFCVLVYAGFLVYYTSPGIGHLIWTTRGYSFLDKYGAYWHFFINTIVVAVGAAALTTALAVSIAWLVVRRPSRPVQVANVFSFLPLAIPGVITNIALFIATLGTPLFESLAVIVAAEMIAFLPYTFRLAQAAQLQVAGQLEDAARTSGSGALAGYLKINLPLMRPSIVNSFLWVFVHVAKDFSVGLILASGGTALIANIIYSAYGVGNLSSAAAMMVILTVFNLVVVFFARRSFDRASFTPINA